MYAIGDVIGPPWLAHVASAEAISAVEGMAGLKDRLQVNYLNIPGCTYCQPQVASIGLTEEKAREKGYQLKIGRFPFSASGKAKATGETEGLVKLIFDAKYGELLGAHLLGSEATEMIAELGLAKNLEATYEEIFKTVHAHPTSVRSSHGCSGRRSRRIDQPVNQNVTSGVFSIDMQPGRHLILAFPAIGHLPSIII